VTGAELALGVPYAVGFGLALGLTLLVIAAWGGRS
jgi:hypothetical protein